jgi:hypothetical protein
MKNSLASRLACAGAVVASISFAFGTALAADGPPAGKMPPAVIGTIVNFDGKVLAIKTTEREDVSLTLATDVHVIDNQPATLADVRSNEFIGTTAVEEKDGKLHSREIHIFPESMRGAGEGHNPMGSPDTTMTNGNIATMTNGNVSAKGQAASGTVLKVTYKGGEKEIEVGADTSIVRMVPSDTSILKPGARVMAFTKPSKNGLIAMQITVTTTK